MRKAPADRRTDDVAGLLSVIALVATATSAAAGFVPGGGPERTDCYTQLYVEGVDYPGPQVRAKRIVTCTDGDPCDQDVRQRSSERACGDEKCEFRIAICVGRTDPRSPACTPAPLRGVARRARRLGLPGRDFETDYIPRSSLLTTALPDEWRSGACCGNPIDMEVQGRVTRDGRRVPGRLEIALEAIPARGEDPARDRDTIVLECLPRTTPCPDVPPTSTTTTLPPVSRTPTVLVGAGGGIRFDPDTVRIRAGDTVRWVWEGSGYDLVSDVRAASDGSFCYPSCDSSPFEARVLTGAVFEHTFPVPGTFGYGTTRNFPMRGLVIVDP
jgi:plastocyanin